MSTVTVTNLPVRRFGGTVLGTAVATTTVRRIDMETALGATDLTLPAGRWYVRAHVTAKPGSGTRPVTWTTDTTLGAPGTITIPALTFLGHLDVEGLVRRDVLVEITVLRHNGSQFVPYATTGNAGSPVLITGGTPPAYRTGQLRGANCHPAGVTDGAAMSAAMLPSAADIGFDVVRFSVVPSMGWQSNGTFTAAYLAETDLMMNAVAARGLKALLSLGVSALPAWYSGSGATYSFANASGGYTGNYKVGGEGTNVKRVSQADCSAIVQALVTRYGASSIYGFEAGNEPDAASANRDPADVVIDVRQLKTAIAASTAPTLKTVGYVLTGGVEDYFDGLVAGGMVETDFDLFCLHAYHIRFAGWDPHVYDAHVPMIENYEGSVAGVDRFRDHYEAAGFTKPFAVSEYGVSSTRIAGYALSPTEQASDLVYMTKQLARLPYVDLALIHTLEDRKSDDAWLNRFGLLTGRPGGYKPSAVAMKALLATLPA